MNENFRPFLENRNLIALVDALARRYGLLPIDVLMLSPNDFNLSLAIMIIGVIEEEKAQNNPKQKYREVPLSSLGIERSIIIKKK